MYNHEPENYDCPFCLAIQGVENEKVLTKQQDIFYKDEYVTALVSAQWWPKNKGHVIIIPNTHFENLYDIPNDALHHVYDLAKRVAIGLKETYRCDGVSTRQHNEHFGGQDVWHFHMHVFPRYTNDNFYPTINERIDTTPEERLFYCQKLRDFFAKK